MLVDRESKAGWHDADDGIAASVHFYVAIEIQKDGLLMTVFAAALLAIRFGAALTPARRAASIEPMEALRDE